MKMKREWLKDIRIKKGMSQKAIADGAGISQVSYCTIESGKTNPSVTTAKAIADMLGFEWVIFFD